LATQEVVPVRFLAIHTQDLYLVVGGVMPLARSGMQLLVWLELVEVPVVAGVHRQTACPVALALLLLGIDLQTKPAAAVST
jgi:hypothetical protein